MADQDRKNASGASTEEADVDDQVHSVADTGSRASHYVLGGLMIAGAVLALGLQLRPVAVDEAGVSTVEEDYDRPTRTLEVPDAKHENAASTEISSEKALTGANTEPGPTAPDGDPAEALDWWTLEDARGAEQARIEHQHRREALTVKFNAALEPSPPGAEFQKNTAWAAGRTEARNTAVANALASSQALATDGGDQLSQRLRVKAPAQVLAQWRPDATFRLSQGKTLTCTLETAIQSDLPGITRCVINQDMYSDDGRQLLIPRGSAAIGEYQGGLRNGVSRIFVIWTRLRTPTDLDVQLASPGTGELGESGLLADVNSHFMARFGASSLLSIIGGLAATESGGNGDRYAATASSFSRSADIALENSINIRPTGAIRQGTKIIIMVAQDVDFGPALAQRRAIAMAGGRHE